MGSDRCKNDVKTLFLIFNTFSGVGTGLFLFSFGVGTGVLKEMETSDILDIVVGLAYVGVGLCGYCGAIAENKKTLRAYYSVMIMRSVSNVTRLVKWSKLGAIAVEAGTAVSPEELLGIMILETIITMVTVLLAVTLAANADRDANNANNQQVVKAVC